MEKNYKKINCTVNNKEIIRDLIISTNLVNSKETSSNNYIKVIKDLDLEKKILKILSFEYLPVREIVLVTIPKNSSSLIHTDGNFRKLALLLPITNCEGIIFNWWKELDDKKINSFNFPYKNSQVEPIKILYNENAKLVDHTYIKEPTLVNIKNFHNVENTSTSDNLEILLSIRLIFNEEESFEKFENLLNNI